MFIPRINKPQDDNKFYIKYPAGFNPCILGNVYHRDKNLNVLPNCVGYACGRFNEIIGEQKYSISMNAKQIFIKAKSLGLKTGVVPQVGSIIVWSSVNEGHCAIVEEVISSTEIIISQSGWNSELPFWRATHRKGIDGNWLDGSDYRWMKGKYTFLGFVYNPAISEKESTMKPSDLKIKFKGKIITIKDNFNADGKNYTSVRELLSLMGYKVGWNATEKVVTIDE